jgi:hypothetical protein
VAFAERVRSMQGLYIDLGFGAAAVTSAETRSRLRRLNPDLRVLGVEIDPARVRAAQRFAGPGLEFRLGGFNLPLEPGERASVIRAFNVLRQYDETEVAAALAALCPALERGGLLIEGTSDPTGRLMAFELHEATPAGLARRAMVFAPTVDADFAPPRLRAILPKSHIHRAGVGGAVDRFFAAWQAAWLRARRRGSDPRRAFVESARDLAEGHGHAVDPRPTLLRRGFLLLGASWPEPARGRAR